MAFISCYCSNFYLLLVSLLSHCCFAWFQSSSGILHQTKFILPFLLIYKFSFRCVPHCITNCFPHHFKNLGGLNQSYLIPQVKFKFQELKLNSYFSCTKILCEGQKAIQIKSYVKCQLFIHYFNASFVRSLIHILFIIVVMTFI